MKKSKIVLTSIFIFLFCFSGTISFGNASYNCASSKGTENILQVKVVNNNSLNHIFGSNWTDQLQLLFGPGAYLKHAKMMTKVTDVKPNVIANFTEFANFTNVKVCNITTNVWYWTLNGFNNSNPDIKGQSIQIMNNPNNLTNWIRDYSTNMSDPSNMTMKYAWSFGWLNYVPVPPANYLRDLTWDSNYSISSSIITHHVRLPYFVQINNSTRINYYTNCTEKWTYDSVYGALVDYTLIDENGTIAYRFSVVLPPLISGFDGSIILGSIGIMVVIGVIYSLKKKKE